MDPGAPWSIPADLLQMLRDVHANLIYVKAAVYLSVGMGALALFIALRGSK